jgi:hypothetical protein
LEEVPTTIICTAKLVSGISQYEGAVKDDQSSKRIDRHLVEVENFDAAQQDASRRQRRRERRPITELESRQYS